MLEAFVEVDFTDVGSFQWISEFRLKVRCRHWTVCDDYSIGHEWFRNTEIQWTVPCLGEYCTAQRRSKYQTVNQYRNVIIMKGHRDQLHSFSHTYQNPTRQICSGAFSHGILLNTPLLSRAFIIIGGITVAKYLALIFMASFNLNWQELTHSRSCHDNPWEDHLCYPFLSCPLRRTKTPYLTTQINNTYCTVLTVERPNLLFCSSKMGTPFLSSLCLISGILMALAAATAANGTNRPIRGGALCSSRVFVCQHSNFEWELRSPLQRPGWEWVQWR